MAVPTDLSIKDVLGPRTNHMADASEKKEISGGMIAGAAVMTLVLSTILTAIIWTTAGLPAWLGIPLFIVIALVHPYVGRFVSTIALDMADAIDAVYELREPDCWGGWSKEVEIMFGAAWPITGPIFCTVAGIGLIYGKLYKDLFR
jgi:hypothetical protein